MHENNKIVAVWVDLDAPKELYVDNEDFYRKVYDLQIDMLTTDQPLHAQDVLIEHHKNIQSHIQLNWEFHKDYKCKYWYLKCENVNIE